MVFRVKTSKIATNFEWVNLQVPDACIVCRNQEKRKKTRLIGNSDYKKEKIQITNQNNRLYRLLIDHINTKLMNGPNLFIFFTSIQKKTPCTTTCCTSDVLHEYLGVTLRISNQTSIIRHHFYYICLWQFIFNRKKMK